MRGVVGPGQDVRWIAPDKVRGVAIVIDDVNVAALWPVVLRIGGEHARAKAALAGQPPAVQELEAAAIGVVEQVVEIVLGLA